MFFWVEFYGSQDGCSCQALDLGICSPVHSCFLSLYTRPKQQAKMAEYCRTIFGDMLLTEPLEKYPVSGSWGRRLKNLDQWRGLSEKAVSPSARRCHNRQKDSDKDRVQQVNELGSQWRATLKEEGRPCSHRGFFKCLPDSVLNALSPE